MTATPSRAMLPGLAAQGGVALPGQSLFTGTGPAQLIPLALIMLVGVRLVEFLAFLAPIRPALLLSLGGGAYLWHISTREKKAVLLRDKVFRTMVLYLAWACFTVPFALWPGQAGDTIRGLVVCTILVGAVLLLSPTRPELRRATMAFVAATCIYVVMLLTTGRNIGSNRLQVGMSLDSNDAATIFGICFPLALGLARSAAPGKKAIWMFASGLLMFGVVATGSRGGTLALVAGALVFVLGMRGGARLGYLLLMLAVGYSAWQWGPEDYRARMISLVKGEEDYNQTHYTGREQIWERGRMYWRENPILGVGAGNFPMAEGRQLELQGLTGKWSVAHNSYIQAFAELGTPGGLIFVALLLAGIRASAPLWRPRRGTPVEHRPEYLAALLAAMVGGYFLSHSYAFHMMLTLALATLAGRTLAARGGPAPGTAPVAAPGAPLHPRMRRILASHPHARVATR